MHRLNCGHAAPAVRCISGVVQLIGTGRSKVARRRLVAARQRAHLFNIGAPRKAVFFQMPTSAPHRGSRRRPERLTELPVRSIRSCAMLSGTADFAAANKDNVPAVLMIMLASPRPPTWLIVTSMGAAFLGIAGGAAGICVPSCFLSFNDCTGSGRTRRRGQRYTSSLPLIIRIDAILRGLQHAAALPAPDPAA